MEAYIFQYAKTAPASQATPSAILNSNNQIFDMLASTALIRIEVLKPLWMQGTYLMIIDEEFFGGNN